MDTRTDLPIERTDVDPNRAAAPRRSPATRLTVAWSILLGGTFLSVGLTDLAAGLTSSSRQMIDVGGLVDARIAMTVSGALLTIVSIVHLVTTVGVWRLRPGARDALLTLSLLLGGGAVLVAVAQASAGVGSRTWVVAGIALANLALAALLLQPAHREDIERADARRRHALI